MNRLPLQELIWQLEPPNLDSERPDWGYGPAKAVWTIRAGA
jgi:hypothetical protein